MRIHRFALAAASLALAACSSEVEVRDEAWRAEVGAAGSVIDVHLESDDPLDAGPPQAEILRWVERARDAVVAYYGRFPVERVRLEVRVGSGAGVLDGTTRGGDEPRIRILMGRHADRSDLDDDWILTHEMVHLALPEVDPRHHWIEEGLATYIEPLARLEAGQIPPDRVWRRLVVGLPHGLPGPDDQGLDRARSWGRTYWGGALFCFLADLEIRRRTGGRATIRDALIGIQEAGGSIEEIWSIDRLIEVADRATRTRVFADLYERLAETPATVDLDRLWSTLGVELEAGGVAFRDSAAHAGLREAITRRLAAEMPAADAP